MLNATNQQLERSQSATSDFTLFDTETHISNHQEQDVYM